MAWRCSGSTNDELVDNLCNAKIIKSERIREAMKATDRKFYALPGSNAYEDAPQRIGFNATISAPHMHAHALEYLVDYLKPGATVLDVGCGSGYLVGILHELVQPGGKVIGIDHIKVSPHGSLGFTIALHKLIYAEEQGLTDMSISNLRKDKYSTLLDSGEVEIITGDGRKGYPPAAPFDVIHIGAAAPNKPIELIQQLKNGGRMFVPVGTRMQDIWLYDKDENGTVKEQKLFGALQSSVRPIDGRSARVTK